MINKLVKAIIALIMPGNKCNHPDGAQRWHMREAGMGKARYCIKCGKCLELI